MARRIFISYQHNDRMKAKGFNLLKFNKNVDFEYTGRHLLDPVNSENKDYITSKIKEQLKGTSVTIVLIGKDTHESTWVNNEVQWSLDKGNGILGIKIDKDVKIPDSLKSCGAEVIEWDHTNFSDAIERAGKSGACGQEIQQGVGGNNDQSCNR